MVEYTVVEFTYGGIYRGGIYRSPSTSLRSLSKKTLFLMSLATAERVGELQALSSIVSFSSEGAVISYVPEFLAKMESALQPLSRSFLVKSY